MTITSSSRLQGAKIFVAGHKGLAGSAIMRRLGRQDCVNIVTRTHSELDLSNQAAVARFFSEERPDYVFLAAAKVGGILANNTQPAEFIYANLAIQTNVIGAARDFGVKTTICSLAPVASILATARSPSRKLKIYADGTARADQNRPYAVAKIAGIETCWAFNRQIRNPLLWQSCPPISMGPMTITIPLFSHVLPAFAA